MIYNKVHLVCIYLLCTYLAYSNCLINISGYCYYVEPIVEFCEREKNRIELILQTNFGSSICMAY